MAPNAGENDRTSTRPEASDGGSEPNIAAEPRADQPGPCYGCRVEPGQPHDDNCDHARCPDCGEQLIFHDCEWWEGYVPDRPAIWHGMSPTEEVARAMGWWTTAVGIDGPVEDHTAVLVAEARGLIGWNRETQRYNFPDHPIPAPEH